MIPRRTRPQNIKPQDWRLVFELARVNGAENYQHELPAQGWDWPKQTYLQTRLEQKRKEQTK